LKTGDFKTEDLKTGAFKTKALETGDLKMGSSETGKLETYFDMPKNPFFYCLGYTGDSFLSGEPVMENISGALYRELAIAGYERIVYYCKNKKLYCYDDRSFDLAKGKIEKRKSLFDDFDEFDIDDESENTANQKSTPLHMGQMDNKVAYAQIQALIYDSSIKTAVVFENSRDFFSPEHGFATSFLNDMPSYERLSAENSNIIVTIFNDKTIKYLLETEQGELWTQAKIGIEAGVQTIHIGRPYANEIRLLLLMLKIDGRLEIKASDLDVVSQKLANALRADSSLGGLKMLASRLVGKSVDRDNCYSAIGAANPLDAAKTLNSMIGMEGLKKKLDELGTCDVEIYEPRSRLAPRVADPTFKKKEKFLNFALIGSPGTGKSVTAMLIGQILHERGWLEIGHTVKTTATDLISKYMGATFGKTREKINEAMGGILFIDEAYGLHNIEGHGYGTDALTELVEAMTSKAGQFGVIMAGYNHEIRQLMKDNTGLASRMTEIVMPDYSPDEMRQIFEAALASHGFTLSQDVKEKLPAFCEEWVRRRDDTWANGRTANNLAEAVETNYKSNHRADDGNIKEITMADFPDTHKDMFSRKIAYKTALERLQALVGMDGAKRLFEDLIKASGNARAKGIALPFSKRNFIIRGGPGAGKTTLARLIGDLCKQAGILASGHTVFAPVMELKALPSKNVKKYADQATGGVLVIEDAWNLGQEALDALAECLKDIVAVLVVPPTENRIAGHKISSVCQEIILEDIQSQQVCEILKQLAADDEFALSQELENKLSDIFGFMQVRRGRQWENAREAVILYEKLKIGWINMNAGDEKTLDVEHVPQPYFEYLRPQSQFRIRERTLPKASGPLVSLVSIEDVFEATVLISTSMMTGSGFLISPDGLVATCEHVVRGSSIVKVRLLTGGKVAWHSGTVLIADKELDLAVVKIDVSNCKCLPLMRELPKPLDPVHVVGYPYGDFGTDDLELVAPSVFVGCVASVQKDSSIYLSAMAFHGNSGGPVVNMDRGEVIGILEGGYDDKVPYVVPAVSFLWAFTDFC
jgi:S1-C subfamily serine protease/DNA replication protein DnaC